jgi:hypothetical protein
MLLVCPCGKTFQLLWPFRMCTLPNTSFAPHASSPDTKAYATAYAKAYAKA